MAARMTAPAACYLHRQRLSSPRSISDMSGFVVSFPGLPQLPDDRQPAVPQGPVSSIRIMSPPELVEEVGLCPARMLHALPRQIIQGPAQRFVTGLTELNPCLLATAPGDGYCTRYRLKDLCGWQALPVIPHSGQQPGWGERPAGARKLPPPPRFGVCLEYLCNAPGQVSTLLCQTAQAREDHQHRFGIPCFSIGGRRKRLERRVDVIEPPSDWIMLLPEELPQLQQA